MNRRMFELPRARKRASPGYRTKLRSWPEGALAKQRTELPPIVGSLRNGKLRPGSVHPKSQNESHRIDILRIHSVSSSPDRS